MSEHEHNPAMAALRHHVTGAIERGEAEPVTAVEAEPQPVETIKAEDARVGDRIKAPEGRVFYELTVTDHKPGWEDDTELVELGNGWGSLIVPFGTEVERENWQVGDAAAEVEANKRSRIDDLYLLLGTAEGKGEGWADPAALEALGVEDKHATEGDDAEDEAAERLDEYALCVESTRTFEIVIGTGGPDDRFLIECTEISEESTGSGSLSVTAYEPARYEIDRVLYRYSWTGSAERILSGDDRETVEAYARRVVPALADA